MADLQFQSRDEAKKRRELEEARKAGTAPAEKDEEGRDINPHIPQYISKAPWYLNQTAPGLKHQRYKEAPKKPIEQKYQKGVKEEKSDRYRIGACKNCGAMTHQAKDCVERPRKKGAKYTNNEICPDEYIVPEITLDYDGKRDRWATYNPDEYKLVINDYELAEVERKRRKAFEIQNKMSKSRSEKKKKLLSAKLEKLNSNSEGHNNLSDENSDSDSDSEADSLDSDDEDVKVKEFDQTSAPMGSKDDNTRTTTRNLRIREDTAKYLYNLDIDSAFYDPKSRSMRANPLQNLKEEDQVYKGDNYMRMTGDTPQSQAMELFAWEVYKRNGNVHMNALPTQLEHMYKEHQEKKKDFSLQKKQALLDKYGGAEYLNAPKEVIFSQTEYFEEYTVDGSAIKKKQRSLLKSKYVEDEYYSNHSSVWGSWYDFQHQKWGYACCLQTFRFSECTVEENIPANPDTTHTLKASVAT